MASSDTNSSNVENIERIALSSFLCIKVRTFRPSYPRIVQLFHEGWGTLDPANFAETNRWTWAATSNIR